MERSFHRIMKDITGYRKWLERRDTKYTRNFNRAVGNQARMNTIWELYGQPLAFYFSQVDEDTGILPVLNVIMSCNETLVSKISQTKVRPFFNAVNGSYKTLKICENTQTFFDEYYQENNIYRKATEAFLDACIFEYGVCWIDESKMSVEKVNPWNFYYDPAEFHYGGIGGLTRCFLEFRDYPVSMLVKDNKVIPDDMLANWEENPDLKCKWNIYYDLSNKQRIEIINDKETIRIPLTSDSCPFEVLWYKKPIKGGFSTSLVDDLYPIQTQIDTLVSRIHVAAELNPAQTFFVPNGSLGKAGGMKVSNFSNKIGTVVSYDSTLTNGSPVTVSTPRFIDPSYQESLDYFIQKAYEMTGISQLSAQAKKPTGLNSGVALDTYQDVESERWNVLLQNYIRFLMGIAVKMIEIFPDEADIIPKRKGVSALRWKDVKAARKEYSIQFSPASVLSNDPKTKMEEIEKLISMKILTGPQASKLLEFPDLQGGFNVLNASFDNCQAIIERAVEDEDYDFYEVVNMQELYSEIVSMILRLDANNEKPETIQRLITLMNKCKHQMDQLNQVIHPATPPNNPPPPLLQGNQITAVTDILKDVKAGLLDHQSAILFLQMAFPEVSPNQITNMVNASLPGGQAVQQATQPQPPPPSIQPQQLQQLQQ